MLTPGAAVSFISKFIGLWGAARPRGWVAPSSLWAGSGGAPRSGDPVGQLGRFCHAVLSVGGPVRIACKPEGLGQIASSAPLRSHSALAYSLPMCDRASRS